MWAKGRANLEEPGASELKPFSQLASRISEAKPCAVTHKDSHQVLFAQFTTGLPSRPTHAKAGLVYAIPLMAGETAVFSTCSPSAFFRGFLCPEQKSMFFAW